MCDISNTHLQELLEKEKLVFDVETEHENAESKKKSEEDIEVYSQEFFSKAKINAKFAKPFNFKEIVDKCEKLTDDGGVMKLLTKRGIGLIVPPRSSALVKFSAYAEYADEAFDCCKVPVTIDLGSSMLRGMNIALGSMRKSEKASFYFQPHYAYGRCGCIKPFVPPDSICLFVMEMVDYEEKGGAGEYFDLPPAERHNVPYEVMAGIVKIKKKEAQRHFRNKDYDRAKSLYQRDPEQEAQKLEHKDLLLKTTCNSALCHLNLNDFEGCLRLASEALEIDANSPKALYFKAKALQMLGDVDRGLEVMMQAFKLAPKNKDINAQLQAMNKAVGEGKKGEKKVYEKMMEKELVEDEEDSKAVLEPLHEELHQQITCQLTCLKESGDLSQKITLPQSNFTRQEIATIHDMALTAGLKVYDKTIALVIAKL